MKSAVASLNQWHKTRKGYAVFGAAELLAGYLLISRAIDTGSLWQYGLGIILTIGAAQNFLKAVRITRNGKE